MMRCRICGSTKNLKYTPAEIRGSQKNKRLPLPLKEIANAINGNICRLCDLRLETFHKEEIEEEIDITDDDRFCEMFYKRQHAQLAAVRSLGSDGDPEVIEVLTSRETTPDIPDRGGAGRQALNTNTRIVDVIDLEDDESNDKLIELVERKPNTEPPQENLLGCLSLVTSDSESSEINFEPCHKANTISKDKTPQITIDNNNKEDSECTEQNFPVCLDCGIRFLDTASLQVHTKDNHQLPCPVCLLHLKTDLELVYHIRQKHRQYNGELLCEGAKCAQDSAMTIRLRFKQSLTFYECQLCGFIDSQFKTHKDHIIENHPDESKSLRDPMMKTKLSCPACHQKIGTHLVDVCRHLVAKHQEKYNKYIKEVTDLKALPTKNPKSLQKIKHTARVLAFINKADEYFYECQLCNKIFGSFRCFLQHLNAHNIDEFTEYEGRKSGSLNLSQARKKRKTEEHKADDLKPKNKTDVEESGLKTKEDKTEKTKKPIKTLPKDAIASKKQDAVFKKPSKQAIPSVEPTATASAPDENKRQKKLKRRSKNGTIIVKVKAPLRHFPTQKYDCKHCHNTFKGFRKLHLHMLQMHAKEEFKSCSHCPQMFATESRLSQHIHCSHTDTTTTRHKRKFTVRPIESEKVDENFNKEHSSKRARIIEPIEVSTKLPNKSTDVHIETPAWLEEVYQLSWDKKKEMCTSSLEAALGFFRVLSNSDKKQLQQNAHNLCKYCARLFAEPLELSAHEQLHVNVKDMPWINVNTSNQDKF